MATKIIYPGVWELDISHIKLERVENNSYFSDTFWGTSSYPFELHIDSLHPQFIYTPNTKGFKREYSEVILMEDGKIEAAKLIVLECQGNKVSFQFIVGFDDLPNSNKKLSEFDFPKIKTKDLYTHAESLLPKKYPDVKYNFPAVHTSMVDTTNKLFKDFKGTYNLYKDGKFVKNRTDFEDSKIINENIMNPSLYLLYILEKGIEDAGYLLEGNIFNDQLLKSVMVFKGFNQIYDLKFPDPMIWHIQREDYDRMDTHGVYPNTYFYNKVCDNNIHGIFKVKGDFDFETNVPRGGQGEFTFKLGDEVLFTVKGKEGYHKFEFAYTNDPKSNRLLSVEGKYLCHPADLRRRIMTAEVSPIGIFDEDNNIINPNFDSSEIDLSKYVPDITFGDFLRKIKNTFNLDIFRRKGRIISMDLINNNLNKYENIKDISEYDVLHPKITFNAYSSFLLKFQYENEQYPLSSLYVDKTGCYSDRYVTQEDTIEIISQAIPLPLESKNNINSAKYISDDDSYISLIIFNGLDNGQNNTQDNKPLLWNNLYSKYWQKWLKFRINAISFTWNFTALKEKIKDITVKKKLYAYHKVHIPKKITRTDLSDQVVKIEVETYSE